MMTSEDTAFELDVEQYRAGRQAFDSSSSLGIEAKTIHELGEVKGVSRALGFVDGLIDAIRAAARNVQSPG